MRVLRTIATWKLISALAVPVAIVLLCVFGIVAVGGMMSSGTAANQGGSSCSRGGLDTTGGPGTVPGSTVPGLTSEQDQNARTVVATVLAEGGGRAGARIALVVVFTEATLVAVNYGDYNSSGAMTTSRGLYQQMDHWGPLEVRLDPAGSTRLFLHGGGGNRGLFAMPNWWTADPWVAAQWVERSQFTDGSNYRGNLATTDAILDVILAGQTVEPLPTSQVQALAGQGTTDLVNAPAGAPAAEAACGVATGAGGVANPATGLTLNPSQDPSTFGWVHNGPTEPLVYQGHSLGQVAKGTVPLWTGLLNDLVPVIPGGLNNNLGCYEDRSNVNSPGRLSFHAYALACDLNYDRNPNGVSPSSLFGEYVIPAAQAQALAPKWGMEWGGTWGYPDPMHFEIHLSPEQVASLVTTAPA